VSAEKLDGFATIEKRLNEVPPKIATTLNVSIGKLQRTAFARISPNISHSLHPSQNEPCLRNPGALSHEHTEMAGATALQAIWFSLSSICERCHLGNLAAGGVSATRIKRPCLQ